MTVLAIFIELNLEKYDISFSLILFINISKSSKTILKLFLFLKSILINWI